MTCMTMRELIDYCLTLPQTYEDYPFEPNGCAVRHIQNKKIFAYIFDSNDGLKLVYKADPLKIQFWRDQFESVKPAFHWNKNHWNEALVNQIDFDSTKFMILDSFELTKLKIRGKRAC